MSIGSAHPVRPGPRGSVTDVVAEEFDRVAAITAEPGTAAQSRARYVDEPFRVPAHVYNLVRRRDEPVVEIA
jgi:hypothetical protein